MYKLSYLGTAFDLGDSTLPVEWINSWFVESDKKHHSDYTWQFTLPYTANNRSILGDLAQPQLVSKIDTYINCTLDLSGDVKPVRLYVGPASKSGFKVRCLLSEGSFDVMEKNLNSLNLQLSASVDVDDLTTNPQGASFHNSIYPDAQVCWPPLIAQDFLSDQEPSFLGRINAYSSVDGKHLNNYLNASVPVNRNAMAPQPFLCWILERGFEEMGLQVKGEAWEAEFVRRMFLYANQTVEDFNEQQATLAIASYNNVSGQVHSMDALNTTPINFTSGTNFNTTTDQWTINSTGEVRITMNLSFTRNNPNLPSPRSVRFALFNPTVNLSISKLITGVDESLGDGSHSFTFNMLIPDSWDGDEVSIRLYDFNGDDILITLAVVGIYQTSTEELNTFGEFDEFTTGLPDMTFGELLTELGKPPFGIKFDYDFSNQLVEMSFKSSNLSTGRFEKVSHSENEEVERVSTKYHWSYEEPSGDRFLDDLRPAFLSSGGVIVNGEWSQSDFEAPSEDYEEIVQSICPIAQSLGTTKDLRIEVHAQSEYYDTDSENPSPRIGFYLGLVDNEPRADILFEHESENELRVFSFDHDYSLSMFDYTIIPWLKWRSQGTRLKLSLLLDPIQIPFVVYGKLLELQWGPAVLNRASAELDRDSRRVELEAEVILL